jgi:ribosomal protein S18 acetylase RimI-like enzyme
MSEILREFVPSSMIGVIEANTTASFLAWTKWDRLKLHQDGDDRWIESAIPFFIYNVVLQTENTSGDVESVIDFAIFRATSRQVPMAWWVGPSDPVPGMGKHLEAKGFVHAATLTGMAMDLWTLDEPASIPQGFTISKINNAHDLETWCQIMTEVSEFPDFARTAWLEMYQGIGIIEDPLWRLYLGSKDGTPVSTSALFWGAGVAGIHAVTTQPDYRGRGIGNAMTLAPLLDSQSQGYRVGVLFSSEMATGIYRKSGFQEYGDGKIYLWQPPGE